MSDPTFEQTALHLDDHIAHRLQTAADALAQEGIPTTIIAHTMIRLGLQGVLTAEGAKQMHQSASELLHALTPKS